MQISLRPAIETDNDFLYQVFLSTRDQEAGFSHWQTPELEPLMRQQFQLQDRQYRANYPQGNFDLVLADDNPVGRLYVHRNQTEIRLIDIALLPEYRQRGIGRQLLNELVVEADNTTLPLTLHVECNNPVIDFYRRLGFQQQGETDDLYYFMRREPEQPC